MEAKDLRIGNYVEYNSILWRVSEIRSPKQLKHTYYSDKFILELYNDGLIDAIIDDVSPIPLTEEWLLKTGCDKIRDCFVIDRFRLRWLHPFKYFYVTDDNTGTYFTKLEFIHEWQNFYFILQGEELTIQDI